MYSFLFYINISAVACTQNDTHHYDGYLLHTLLFSCICFLPVFCRQFFFYSSPSSDLKTKLKQPFLVKKNNKYFSSEKLYKQTSKCKLNILTFACVASLCLSGDNRKSMIPSGTERQFNCLFFFFLFSFFCFLF